MADIGTITQYGSYEITENNNRLELSGHCIVGISISEDDYMACGTTTPPGVEQINEKSFRFTINGKQIWMGRTYMYQTEKQVNNTIITFPDGVPASTRVEVVYCTATKG